MTDLEALIGVLPVGLLAGSLVLEGALLVPYWRTLQVPEFVHLHAAFGPRLFRFFAPLTTVAILSLWVPLLTEWFRGAEGTGWTWAAAVGGLAVLAFYFLFFQSANLRFSQAGLTAADLRVQLKRWALVHHARTIVALLTFAAAAIGARV